MATAKVHNVSGHFWVDFLATLDCVGQSFPSKIAGHPVTIVLPGRDPDPKARSLLPPVVRPTKNIKPDPAHEQSPAWGKLTNAMECTFGMRFKGGFEEIEMAKFTRIALSTAIKTGNLQESRTYKHIVEGINDWLFYAGSWIQIFAAKHVRWLAPRRRAGDGAGLTLWDGDTQLDMRRVPVGFPEYFSIPVTREELAASIRLAGERAEPPLEWMLIRDAQYLV
jgi:hypothetical protein